MGRKRDLRQVDNIAREFNMTPEGRQNFGEFLEEEKRNGNGGTLNSKGDFTYSELRKKAQEFLGDI